MKNFISIVLIVIFLLLIGSILLKYRDEYGKDTSVACTMDAMECSDGSYVGRVPPDCKFSPCP